jgi:hypothetical protein
MFTEAPSSERVRGVHYDEEIDPVTGRIFYTDSETGVPVSWLEDGLYYYYRVIAFKPVAGFTCSFTGEPNLRCRGADTDTVFLPIARPGSFTLSRQITGDPPIVDFDWTAALYTVKGGEPKYDVERSRTIGFISVPPPICNDVLHTVRTCEDTSPLRGLTYYRVRATNSGGDTFSSSAQAGLHLFPEEFREVSPF